MAGANDNVDQKRQIRDGLEAKWQPADLGAIFTDEALLRLAEARNLCSKSANRFMLFAALLAALYFLRLQNIADQLAVGAYDLGDLPFGLFALCGAALTLSSVSLLRFGDSRAYDRKLRFVCEKKYDCDCELRYLAFPNEHAWGEPFSRLATMLKTGKALGLIRGLSQLSSNLFLLLLVIAPILAGLDFLLGNRAGDEVAFQEIQKYSIVFLLAANALILVLVSWVRMADRE